MQLREYQKDGFCKGIQIVRRGRKSLVFVMPPGAGKTVMGTWFAVAVAKMFGGKILWVAHRRELIKQAIKTVRRFGFTAGAIAPRMKRDDSALFQVASIQTLRTTTDAIPPEVVIMVWDECHHAVSDDWVLLAKEARRKKIFLAGLTATPERSDGRGLSPLFGTMVEVATSRTLIRQNFLVPTCVLVPDEVLEDGIADAPVRLWERHAPNTQTIVFCENVDHAIGVAEEFALRGYKADFVEGEMTTRERDKVLKRFAKGSLQVVTNCQLLTEGFDLPRIQTVILARRIGSHAMYLQMVGRGSRPFDGKKTNLVLDLVGNAHMFGLPEDDRTFSLRGRPIQLRGEEEIERRRKCRSCGLIFVDPATKICPMCMTPVATQRSRRLHEKVLKRMTSAQEKAYETAALDRWRDYARIHNKPDQWVTDRFVKKFGKLPQT